MLKILLILIKYAATPVMAALIFLWVKVLSGNLVNEQSDFYQNILTDPLFFAFISGLGFRVTVYLFCKFLKWSDSFSFIDTLEHELTHAFFGYLTLSPPTSLLATLESGGEVKLGRRNVLIVLSPYFFPLWTFIAILISFLVKSSLEIAVKWIAVFLLGVFFYRLLLEYRWYQNDFKIYGRVFSMIASVFMLLSVVTVFFHFMGILDWQWTIEIFMELIALAGFYL